MRYALCIHILQKLNYQKQKPKTQPGQRHTFGRFNVNNNSERKKIYNLKINNDGLVVCERNSLHAARSHN